MLVQGAAAQVKTAASLAQEDPATIANRRRLEDNETMAQYIYTMQRVSKVVPPKRVILRDISLSLFFPERRSACWA